MAHLITAAQARELGLPEDAQDRRTVLRAAGEILEYVRRNPFAAETDARKHAEGQDIGPDLFNAALRYLEAAGELHTVDTAPPAAAGMAPGTVCLGDLTRFRKDTLLDIAAVLEIDVPRSGTKDEIAQRLGAGA